MPLGLIAIFLILSFVPSWWVRRVVVANTTERGDIRGTGGQLAQHLIERYGLTGVRVVRLDERIARDATVNFYDPTKREVALAPAIYDGRSMSAIAIAAHEVGHAMQHAHDEPLFRLRGTLVQMVGPVQRMASIVLFAAPVLALITRSPAITVLMVIAAVLMMLSAVAVHAITLPVEFDASFGKALPVLEQGGYLSFAGDDEQSARQSAREVLRAAALSYVAAALVSLLNIGYWLRLLR